MKLIYAIVERDNAERVTDALNSKGYQATMISSTGGFLKKGNATLMVGTDEDRVDTAIELIRETCGKRQKITCDIPSPNIGSISAGYVMMPVTVELGGATIFVTDVERFEKF